MQEFCTINLKLQMIDSINCDNSWDMWARSYKIFSNHGHLADDNSLLGGRMSELSSGQSSVLKLENFPWRRINNNWPETWLSFPPPSKDLKIYIKWTPSWGTLQQHSLTKFTELLTIGIINNQHLKYFHYQISIFIFQGYYLYIFLSNNLMA